MFPLLPCYCLDNLFLSCWDSLAWSSGNVSTQLARFPLASHYHANPCFKSPMAFVVHLWQTQALLLYLSLLNPDELLSEGKCRTNLVQKQLVTQSLGATTRL